MVFLANKDADPGRVTAWQCIGCGKIDAPATCIGVCQDRKTEFVYGFIYDELLEKLELAGAQAEALKVLARRLAVTTPRAGEWERSYKAFQDQARRLLEGCDPALAGDEPEEQAPQSPGGPALR